MLVGCSEGFGPVCFERGDLGDEDLCGGSG